MTKADIIAIVGGTGKEGKGLAYRWAKAGYKVLIGSRNIERALAAANELNNLLGNNKSVEGLENIKAAGKANIVVLTVPYQAHKEILSALKDVLQGKILIDVTVPLIPPQVTKIHIPKDGSAAVEAQNILGSGVSVVSAFQNIAYDLLLKDQIVDCDVLVSGSNNNACQRVIKLAEDAHLRAWEAGPLENSIIAEGLTSILIGINKQYGSRNAGIKITGVNRQD